MEFLAEVVATQSAKTHVHIIADNLSTHKTAAVQGFLSAHPNVKLHYTPTYSSWLNQVEIWFSKIQRDLIARGIFESKTLTSTAKSCAISAITIRQLSPLSGLTKTQIEETDKPFTFICYIALVRLDSAPGQFRDLVPFLAMAVRRGSPRRKESLGALYG